MNAPTTRTPTRRAGEHLLTAASPWPVAELGVAILDADREGDGWDLSDLLTRLMVDIALGQAEGYAPAAAAEAVYWIMTHDRGLLADGDAARAIDQRMKHHATREDRVRPRRMSTRDA